MGFRVWGLGFGVHDLVSIPMTCIRTLPIILSSGVAKVYPRYK